MIICSGISRFNYLVSVFSLTTMSTDWQNSLEPEETVKSNAEVDL
jgi:hypothetical protein